MRNTAKIYLRLSRDEVGQTSIDDQERECRNLAARLNITDIHVFTEQPGTSGFKDVARPVYDDLMSSLVEGDIVIAWMLDRLTRKGMEQAGAILRTLEERGAHCVTVADGVDTRMEGAELSVGVRAIVGREYVKSMIKNVKRGKASGAAAGNWGGGNRWYGYALDITGAWRGPNVINDTEAKILEEIRGRYVAGERLVHIARDLNDRGIPTVNGLQWRSENMLRLLLNKRYVGIRVHRDDEYPATWPAIFTPAQHAEILVARCSEERMLTWPSGPTGARTYVLTGIAECHCGNKMRGNAKENKRRYRCRAKDAHGNIIGCGKTYRLAEPLELLVSEAVLYRLDTPELAKLLSAKEDHGQVDALLEEQARIKAMLDELHADYYKPTDLRITRQHFIQQKHSLEAAQQVAETRLQSLMQQRTSITLEAGQSLRNAWDAGTLDWRRRLLGLVVERVIVKPSDTRGIKKADFWNGHRFKPSDVTIVWKN